MNDKNSLTNIEKIEQKRNELISTVRIFGLCSNQTIQKSEELDILLYTVQKEKKNNIKRLKNNI